MEISEAQYQSIASSLPRQRGNVKLDNLQLLNALLYVAEHGCKWRGLPKRFGNWHTIYTRMNRWSKNGVRDQVFEQLQREPIVRIRIEGVSLDSTSQGPSRRHRRVKKNGPQAIGKSRGGWTTKIHMMAADARTAITFALSPGQASDTVEGRKLLGAWGPCGAAASGDGPRLRGQRNLQLALDFGFIPVVPPRHNRLEPWQYDKATYPRRNEIERLFRRLKGFRRIFSRFDKLEQNQSRYISPNCEVR